MRYLALVKVPKTGTTTLCHGYEHLWHSEEYPCLDKAHRTALKWMEHDHEHEFFTLVRDPLQMYCSSYYFLKNRVHKRTHMGILEDDDKHPLGEHSMLLKELGTLDEYLLTCPANDFMPKYYEGTDLDDYIFVGRTEEMATSLSLFSSITGIDVPYNWMNKNPKRPETLQPYYVQKDVVAEFKKRNELEYEYYAKGLERFNALKEKY